MFSSVARVLRQPSGEPQQNEIPVFVVKKRESRDKKQKDRSRMNVHRRWFRSTAAVVQNDRSRHADDSSNNAEVPQITRLSFCLSTAVLPQMCPGIFCLVRGTVTTTYISGKVDFFG